MDGGSPVDAGFSLVPRVRREQLQQGRNKVSAWPAPAIPCISLALGGATAGFQQPTSQLLRARTNILVATEDLQHHGCVPPRRDARLIYRQRLP
jgi:hypothetical protein